MQPNSSGGIQLRAASRAGARALFDGGHSVVSRSFLVRHHLRKMAQFLIHLGSVRYRAAHFLAQNGPVARAKARHVTAQRCGRPAELLRHFFIRDRCSRLRRRDEISGPQTAQLSRPAAIPQPGDPASAAEARRPIRARKRRSGLQASDVAPLALPPAEIAASSSGTWRNAATAFLRVLMIPRVRDKMLERAEQEMTGTALSLDPRAVGAVLDQIGKKALREILCIVRRDALAAEEDVNWSPIDPAKLRERIERLAGRRLRFGGAADDAPAGRGKQALAGSGIA